MLNFRAQLAANYLKSGSVISHPTDTIQSLTCLPRFEHSLCKILQLKRRTATKGLILLASDTDYFSNFVKNPLQLKNVKNTSLPTTYLLKAASDVSQLLTGEFDTIAIRLTDNILITKLCKATNSALVSTSANIATRRCADTMLNLKIAFGAELDFTIAPTTDNNKPSKIIDLQTGKRLR